jgi:hypothetical protein
MTEIIFKYPGQKGVGVATRLKDGTLDHSGFIFVSVLPKKGGVLFDREVSEVLTDEALLKERTLLAQNDIEAVAVLAKTA